jgi:hypothetical protein
MNAEKQVFAAVVILHRMTTAVELDTDFTDPKAHDMNLPVEPVTRTDLTTRDEINSLKEGDRVEIDHEIKVGLKIWHKTTIGTVERFERRRHGLHFKRNLDDKSFSDLIVLRLPDGSLTTVTIDEFTRLKKL